MNILVVGSGGREHAICTAFRRSSKVETLYCAPGNAGIAGIASCVNIAADDVKALADFASANNIGLTFVGGEVPLALGIVDEFERRGLRAIGPKAEGAKLEASKAFAKSFMASHGIPTAKFTVSHSADFAILELESGDFGGLDSNVVVKADGLAAGKGVIVAKGRAAATQAISSLSDIAGSAAADKIILEECLVGREVSLLVFTDGESFALMPPVRDHKRIGDGDVGPNTGGMGTVSDDALLSEAELADVVERIVKPTLHACKRESISFRGIIFFGLMMTANGPMVLEYNVRFGDPETQVILVRLETDLVDICEAMLSGQLDKIDISWTKGSSACVILASEGYPGKARTGDVINGLSEAAKTPNSVIFHAGTGRDAAGNFVTAGGRVLGVTAVGASLDAALASAYEAVSKISWPGMQYRKDIGK
ncbi:MAG: phosphoribosylamine--glycine ligase [Acidobacteria bacterium ACB1]|nr:Phosphoribosylamine--glycine ligase [Pyrinomonadaceae bacterium]MCE7961925.1 phosphoribosylamine--glycine ligase [Acidobacteria bacterium ACB1]RIJ91232.1 MAG: phosphoribosylamine--glycine ligase [Acidobacteriota bacterium]